MFLYVVLCVKARRMKTFFCEDDYLAYTIRRAASTGARQVMAASYFR